MPALLDLYAGYNIKTTFFFTGYIAKLVPEVVKMILPYGHEVGSHGMSHIKENGFDVMPLNKQITHLKDSKKILEDISGEEVISFRAPALRVNQDTAVALAETNFLIDSSIASQRFDMFMSFGGLKKMKWLIAPRCPYRTKSNNLFSKGDGEIVEIPISATLLPYVGTTMRIFPKITSMQRRLLHAESKLSGKPIVFLIHPNEFIDESGESRVISRRVNNYLLFLIQDSLRARLKTKNLGSNCVKLYNDEISYFIKKNYSFLTFKEYYKSLAI
ncbi:MAG: polysaccharide deacetylase family protein [Ignavibacteria bacterium]|nr:polysaccharide deacetylase family protein [Ignavibacteria bacterium]